MSIPPENLGPVQHIEAYQKAQSLVVYTLSNKDLTVEQLKILDSRFNAVFQRTTTAIQQSLNLSPERNSTSLKGRLAEIKQSYEKTSGQIKQRIEHVYQTAIPLTEPGAIRSSPFVTRVGSKQLILTRSPIELIQNMLSGVRANGSFLSTNELSTRSNELLPLVMESLQHPGLSAALEAALFSFSRHLGEPIQSEDTDNILTFGATQNTLIQLERAETTLPSHPDVAPTQAKESVDVVGSYYKHKGLKMLSTKHANVNSAGANAYFQTVLDHLQPNQSTLILMNGRSVSITCRLNERGEKVFALFDSHSSFPDAKGLMTPAMLSSFTSSDDILSLLISRLPITSPTLVQTTLFSFQKDKHLAYTKKAEANRANFEEWATRNPDGLKALIETIQISIQAARHLRESEIKTAQALLQAAEKRKKEIGSTEESPLGTYRSDQDRSIIEQELAIHQKGELLLALLQSLTHKSQDKAFLTRLFGGTLLQEDLKDHKELLNLLDGLRKKIFTQKIYQIQELAYVAHIAASIIGFNKRLILPH